MVNIANIAHKKHQLAFIARLVCLFVAVMFFYGQALSSSHAHENELAHVYENAHKHESSHEHDDHDEAPVHNTCEVCVLAVQNEGDFDQIVDLDVPDVSLIWAQLDRLALPAPESAPGVKPAYISADPPQEPNRRPSAVRAPPQA